VLGPDGKAVAGKWIDGAAADVTLNAPKGMAIVGGTLWVADIDHVRKFDLATGKPAGEVKLDGAAFLNDVAAAPDGSIVVSDTGVDKTFASTGADAIYRIAADGKVTPVIKDKALGSPNGVHVTLPTARSGSRPSARASCTRSIPPGPSSPARSCPRVSSTASSPCPAATLLVTSWEGSAVYRGKPGGEWKAIAENLKAPADLGYDSKRGWMLVPLFTDNGVHAAAVP
jgi:hypothetical protein